MELIFLEPVLKEKIWGGKKLKEEFGFDISSDKIGEAWIISAHQNGVSKISYPEIYKGMGLDELYFEHRELFGKRKEEVFPLLVKLLDASDNLSVQVHPDDYYAQKYEGENELGKTECWYIVSAEENSEIIYGHNALSKEEFIQKVESGKWDELLRRVKVKKGDFFYVPNGTIHAIGKGIVILETQQSSDTTYRVYDYNRTDDNGKKRDLHIYKSIDVAKFPHSDPKIHIIEEKMGNNVITRLIDCEYFSVYQYDCKDDLWIQLKGDYNLATVIDGKGNIFTEKKVYNIEKSQSFIIPNEIRKIKISGNLKMIVSNPN